MSLKYNKRQICISILFILLVFIPGILQISSNLLQKKFDLQLKGNFEQVNKTELTLKSFVEGEFQTSYEKWLNQNIMSRGFFIKAYNQIQFSLFDKGNRIIGKNNDIYDLYYIEEELCLNERDYALSDRQGEMQWYVNHLVSINDKLKESGKSLLVYTTPSKAHFFKDNIPLKYLIQEEEGIRAIDYFRELVRDTDINYLDTESLASNNAYPIFYPTGIHWSRTIEERVSVELMNVIRDITNKKLRNISLGEVIERENPFWRDADVYDLLNVYTDSYDTMYYEYILNREFPEEYDKTNILIQGGSFSEGVQHDFFENYINEKCYYINYGNIIYDKNGWQTINQWSDLNLSKYLDEIDCVVIEINEAAFRMYSSGFVEYLDNYLDSYVPGKAETISSDPNLNPIYNVGLANSRGFWGYEESHIWSTSNSYVTLTNNNISNNGLKMQFRVPEEVLKDGEDRIVVYVNQQKVMDKIFHTAETVELLLNPEEFGVDENDTYEIEFICENSFNPKAIGMSEDSRDLALDVFYIGEADNGI